MNILDSLEYGPVRMGTDRSIDDRTLWIWLELSGTRTSCIETNTLYEWSELSEHKMQDIERIPSFRHDIRSFCEELMSFLETHNIDNISYRKRKSINYAKRFYNNIMNSLPDFKDPDF